MRMFWLFMAACWPFCSPAGAQRSYRNASVLAAGAWYKIAVTAPGIYRVDLAFLQSLGINTANLSSASIRLYGNGGQLLPEPCKGTRTDDLAEDAIWVEDGGDGIFGAGDYFLFYTPGPHHWAKDSVNRRFTHVYNIYTDAAYYFINIGGSGAGRRVGGLRVPQTANVSVNGWDWRLFHELDSVNFLSSGKDWYGEEFSNIPGGAVARSWRPDLSRIDTGQMAWLSARCVARSIGANSAFVTRVGGVAVSELDIPAVTDGSYDVFGRAVTVGAAFRLGAGQGGSGEQSGTGAALTVGYTPGGYNSQGWLDWWELSGRARATLGGGNGGGSGGSGGSGSVTTAAVQLQFRDWASVGSGNVAGWQVQGAGVSTRVWDVTDPAGPVDMQGDLTGGTNGGNSGTFSFTADASRLREFIAFNFDGKGVSAAAPDQNGADAGAAGLFTPKAVGKVENQNLHRVSSPVPDMLIIADPALMGQAARLAQVHLQQDGLQCAVVSSVQVYNEFAGGNPDPAALRDYVKMFYDRSAGDSTKRPRYLLLFGAGSFDYKDRITANTNGVPAYESASSLDPLNTYTSDDFYGFLKDEDDVNIVDGSNLLDIGVGRIPARTVAEATAVVDKIVHYADVKTQGPWRNEINLIADDGDQNLHFQDAEVFAATVAAASPVTTLDKIYIDAYKQQSTPAGSRYPDVNQAISSHIFSGTLVWNYTGHGSNARLSNSDILDQGIINGFNNPDKLPLFITATCDFTPYDNPVVRSIGADLLVRAGTGAIGLMTTTRLVFAFSNKAINDNYLRIAMQPAADGHFYSLGEALRLVKNYTYQNQTDAVNNRKFTLVGDPALTLAFPRYKVVTTAINGRAVPPGTGGGSGPGSGGLPADTLKALGTYTINGAVLDNNGALLSGFNGTVYTTVYDKPRTLSTLGNSAGSFRADFQVQDNLLYKGKAPVTKGLFQFSFVVPKDINYQFGKGRISYYAGSAGAATGGGGAGGGVDGNGVFTNFLVGGSGNGAGNTGGPAIQAYLNDEKFVDGGITGQQPLLLLHLEDSLGINITGLGIGHDITAVLDNNTQDPLVLNRYYEADLNTYKKGTVRYPLPLLAEGEHTLTIRAFNVANISGQAALSFRVLSTKKLALNHVLNYPNPFTTHTTFWFEHNRAGEDLSVLVQILTVSGKLVKSIRRTINTIGNRSSEIDWDGRDDYGSKIGRGVYIYLLRVRATDGSVADKIEKLYIL